MLNVFHLSFCILGRMPSKPWHLLVSNHMLAQHPRSVYHRFYHPILFNNNSKTNIHDKWCISQIQLTLIVEVKNFLQLWIYTWEFFCRKSLPAWEGIFVGWYLSDVTNEAGGNQVKNWDRYKQTNERRKSQVGFLLNNTSGWRIDFCDVCCGREEYWMDLRVDLGM